MTLVACKLPGTACNLSQSAIRHGLDDGCGRVNADRMVNADRVPVVGVAGGRMHVADKTGRTGRFVIAEFVATEFVAAEFVAAGLVDGEVDNQTS